MSYMSLFECVQCTLHLNLHLPENAVNVFNSNCGRGAKTSEGNLHKNVTCCNSDNAQTNVNM